LTKKETKMTEAERQVMILYLQGDLSVLTDDQLAVFAELLGRAEDEAEEELSRRGK